ncbi:MAG: PASTA domain-containing protein [Chloroflexi bacterium]|nr:PASTA domain-containing protein [Chloroflexota bacterium]
MNIPQATAELNRVGLGLGSQISEAWTESSGLPQNTISSQSIAAGQALNPGMLVDVVVLRAPNTILSYDDNDLTLINTTGADLNLNGLIFGVAEGTVPAAFAATRWAGALSAGGCGQIWSVLRSVPKDVEGCGRINAWLTTNNAAEHFWTALNGVSRFKIVQNGVERGSCPVAPAGTQPLRCELYLPANASEGITPYIYFAYTPERFIIHNRSQDQFMPLAGTPSTAPIPTCPHLGSR